MTQQWLLVFESAVRALNNQLVVVAFLYAANNLCIHAKTLADGDDLLGMLGLHINLQTVAHVEYLVHLGPVCAALLLDCLEQRWNGEEVILDYLLVLNKVHYLGLCTT